MVSFSALASKIFGTSNEKRLKRYYDTVASINAMEPEIARLTDEELRGQTVKFREQLAAGKNLNDLLVPAFATIREAAKRVLGQRHFDVQLIGGMVQHEGKISEMRTGEGKTLVSTAPGYLNALTGQGVHVVTVNDYLASRDAEWMGRVYKFLGLTVGCIIHGLDDQQRREAYHCDITYGTNNEFGFDYLRDNMKFHLEDMVQRGHVFAIVDEVDSILIDEARTPLIISGPLEDRSELYLKVDDFIPLLLPEHYEVDEKQKTVSLTEDGNQLLESQLQEAGMLEGDSLYDVENVSVVHHINQALRAHKLFQKDRDYIVKDAQVIIIDEFTGRMMPGRRYSEGLHQALEAKERVQIQPENQTLASITFQNYFRLYKKLAGMTGTAATEANEFDDIYKLQVLEIPTNLPVKRIDDDDEVYRTAREKYLSIIELVKQCRERGQPLLVGTASIEKSEVLSAMLKEQKVVHSVLNARYHEQEAQIIAQAGVPGAVTIATNMAGRGTDIQLGGNADMRIAAELSDVTDEAEFARRAQAIREEVARHKETVLAAGGLYVVGTERHESRRIDNQLRGRSGRQGDPGHSRFFLSLEDDLMRIFGSERMDTMLQRLGIQEGEAIIHPWINKALEKAQQKVEARNFDIRKNVLKYDDVMNDQRKVIFEQRIEIMRGQEISDTVDDMRHQVIHDLVAEHIPERAYAEQWDVTGLHERVIEVLAYDLPIEDWAKEEGIADEEIRERIATHVNGGYEAKRERYTPDIMQQIEKAVLLQTLDHLWREHLVTLDHLRQAVSLRGYAQRDPLNEYKTEAFTLFESVLARLREAVTAQLMRVELAQDVPPEFLEHDELPMMEAHHANPFTGEDEMNEPALAFAGGAQWGGPSRMAAEPVALNPNNPATWGKVQRNAPCPCGSGRKYKHCHGAQA
ncbi:preprotein translocase subunit SecA [Rhodoligotrophos appendicifer]|uniref:preprotein translocase subunit SecA n=1 Tax=Rhodoligotrophos appendicifer TaxID=987056 RepID=UPI00118093C2|nr:preprotein translocase subunit SecA [Rhodoligotrophos appendicifer]